MQSGELSFSHTLKEMGLTREKNGGGLILYNVDQILFLLVVNLYLVTLGKFLAQVLKSSLSFPHWGPRDHPQVWWLTKRTHRAQHVLIAKIYNSEKIQSKISKQKKPLGEVQRKPASSFQESFPSGVTHDVLNSSSNVLWQHVPSVYQGASEP